MTRAQPIREAAQPFGRPIRVLLGKPGLDGHNRGVHVIARALRDAGMEVIYLGIRRTADVIAATAAQEDVDVIGVSILSGAHLELTRQLIEALGRHGAPDIPLVVGGIIPEEDVEPLYALGAVEVLGPGTSLQSAVGAVERAALSKSQGDRQS